MAYSNVLETIVFNRLVGAMQIREGVKRLEPGGHCAWAKIVGHRDVFKLGRSGIFAEFHLQVVPSLGSQWFRRDRSYGSIQVVKHEWMGRRHGRSELLYQRGLHDYYVRQFAQQLAMGLGGTVFDPYGDSWPKMIPCCSNDGCWTPLQYSQDYDALACPRHGMFMTPVELPLYKP